MKRNLRKERGSIHRSERAEQCFDRADLGHRSWPHQVHAADVVGHSPDHKSIGQLQQPLLVYLAQVDERSLCPRVRRRNNQTDFVRPKRIVAQVWRVACEETKAHVHPAFFQRRLDIGRGKFLYPQPNSRVSGDKHPK